MTPQEIPKYNVYAMPLFLFLESERKRQNYVFLLVLKDFCKKKKSCERLQLIISFKSAKEELTA